MCLQVWVFFYLYEVYKIGIFKRYFHRLNSTELSGINFSLTVAKLMPQMRTVLKKSVYKYI